ncbi:MAG: GntR family transcriptional regulator [Pseudomonadales bacterium]|jgi:GntR family transcriptional regulator|nr:GntR family transcriptional regulator [Pseudomonadales bacterium]MDP6472499.1 GntR family transcriptional regulator [Pseudomonadales bacterium]MDP6828690.1 GntR family transcriptional regulator [Pseudomonadales bacterium]MDP6970410.1 GntR family transcriptional regulator [Pseudomonadales bacterium]|tara:strand:- start:2310 stop:2672 length:363 start_codon:yes stop_codon:yes gene_type:complete
MGDWKDNEPIYLQLRDLVLTQILGGLIAEGEAVPSVRQVASEERINPLTVSKAYQLLVDEGLLEKRRGLGMFVAQGAQQAALSQERERFLNEEWPETLARIHALQLDTEQLLSMQIGDRS